MFLCPSYNKYYLLRAVSSVEESQKGASTPVKSPAEPTWKNGTKSGPSSSTQRSGGQPPATASRQEQLEEQVKKLQLEVRALGRQQGVNQPPAQYGVGPVQNGYPPRQSASASGGPPAASWERSGVYVPQRQRQPFSGQGQGQGPGQGQGQSQGRGPFSALIAERSATTRETVQLPLTMRAVEVVRDNQHILEQPKMQLHTSGRRTHSS